MWIALALVTTLLCAGCSSGLVKSLANLNDLRHHLTEKYQDEVNVNLQNSQFLSVVFINSPLNKQDHGKRWARAQDAARFVALNYEDIKTVERIWIAFVESETHFIVFHYSAGIDSFVFDNKGGTLTYQTGPASNDPRTPVVGFSPARNETDVSITRLQLEGDMNHGVALVPSFTVPGERDQNDKLSKPKAVRLDFASYADRKVFPANSQLIIEGDDQLIYDGNTKLLIPDAASPNDKADPQFLTAKLTFEQFAAIGNAQNVRIRLGPKEFQMAPEDIRALHKMADYVTLAPGLGR